MYWSVHVAGKSPLLWFCASNILEYCIILITWERTVNLVKIATSAKTANRAYLM